MGPLDEGESVSRETTVDRALADLGITDPLAADPIKDRLLRYAAHLERTAIPRGFLGPQEARRLLDRHVLESMALAPHLPEGGTVVDVGSGAGLPGLVLACAGFRVLLLEAEGRRATFLRTVSHDLGVKAEVVRARAEEAGRDPDLRERHPAAVARALARPSVALELVLPFVEPGGVALILVGPGLEEDLPALSRIAETLAGGPPELVALEVPGTGSGRWTLRVPKEGRCPDRYPRRTGVPSKRPLGADRPPASGDST